MRFDFENINLIPNKCVVNSRSECDTSVRLGNYTFKLPIIPANMECIIDEKMAIKLSNEGYFYVMHRFNIDMLSFIKKINDMKNTSDKKSKLISSISIGVNSDSYDLLLQILENNLIIDYITVDIAHGHSIKMESMIKFIKQNFPDTFIIAGNISSPKAVLELEEWGADAIKVGIAPGSQCLTGPTTGFGSRGCQASTIKMCADVASVPIIADGGIKNTSDISKSLVMGATMVMMGGMLSGFTDSPGDIISIDNKEYKEYWGSASEFQSGKKNRIEGKKSLVEFKNRSIIDELNIIEECLQSSISYAGGKDLSAFLNVKYI